MTASPTTVTLAANVVTTVTLDGPYTAVRILQTRNPAPITVTTNGIAPTFLGNTDGHEVMPASAVAMDVQAADALSATVVKLISDGTPTVTIVGLQYGTGLGDARLYFGGGGASQSNGVGLTSLKPLTALAWDKLAASSGALTGAAANTPVWSLRYTGSNTLLVRGVHASFLTTTAFTAAQAVTHGLYVARSFSANDSAGTAVSVASDNGKLRTSLAQPSVVVNIASTGALTAGTRTLSSTATGIVSGWSSAVGASTVPVYGNYNLFDVMPDGHPIVLANNEGIVINNIVAMGAAGVGTLTVICEVAEVSSF